MDTYIIRLYMPDDPSTPPGLCGIVEHVRSGGERVFRDGTELLAVLAGEQATRGPLSRRPVSGQD